MPVTEFQPILDPSAFVGACAGLAVGISAVMMDMDVKKRRDLYVFIVLNAFRHVYPRHVLRADTPELVRKRSSCHIPVLSDCAAGSSRL